METGQQLRHSVNVDHGADCGQGLPGASVRGRAGQQPGCVRLGGLVVVSEGLTVTPVSTLPKMCSEEPLPSLVLLDLRGWLPWKLVVLHRTKQGGSAVDRNSKTHYVALKRVWEAVGGNKGFTATCLGKK